MGIHKVPEAMKSLVIFGVLSETIVRDFRNRDLKFSDCSWFEPPEREHQLASPLGGEWTENHNLQNLNSDKTFLNKS
jgi:hypothetical protein